MGVSFAGNGKSDCSIDKSGTQPPTGSGNGSGGGVDFAGDGAKDVNGFSSNTEQHDPSKHTISQEGKGVDFVAE